MNFTPRKEEPIAEKTYESVRKYMATKLITFSPDQDIDDVMKVLLEKKISGGPVVDEKHNLVGMISEKDCLRVMLDDAYYNMPPGHGKVDNYMSKIVTTIPHESDVLDVANKFLTTNFRRFPVVDKGKLVGQVSRRDILKATQDMRRTTW